MHTRFSSISVDFFFIAYSTIAQNRYYTASFLPQTAKFYLSLINVASFLPQYRKFYSFSTPQSTVSRI